MSERTVTAEREKLSSAGVWLYGLSSLVAGAMDLGWRTFDSAHQPIQAFGDHIPGITLMACVAGAWMVAGGAAILRRRTAKFGGAALTIIYLVFAVFWLPRFYWAPHILGQRASVYVGVAAGVGIEIFAAAAGALAWAAAGSGNRVRERERAWAKTLTVVRWACGVCALFFGLEHLMNAKQCLEYVPRWMPLGQEFWVIVTGICFVLAGLAIVSGVKDVLAARMLALLQFIVAAPSDHTAWGGNVFNLTLVAAAWMLADGVGWRTT